MSFRNAISRQGGLALEALGATLNLGGAAVRRPSVVDARGADEQRRLIEGNPTEEEVLACTKIQSSKSYTVDNATGLAVARREPPLEALDDDGQLHITVKARSIKELFCTDMSARRGGRLAHNGGGLRPFYDTHLSSLPYSGSLDESL